MSDYNAVSLVFTCSTAAMLIGWGIWMLLSPTHVRKWWGIGRWRRSRQIALAWSCIALAVVMVALELML